MNGNKKHLLNRIKRLEDWQQEMVVWDLIYGASDQQVSDINKEVTGYVLINKEIEREEK